MTTFYDFEPSAQTNFQFQPTLDGSIYVVSTTWSLFGQRWYVNCYDLSGGLVFTLPLIGSPTGVDVESLAWALGTASATTSIPHGYGIGEVLELTIAGCAPGGWNGLQECRITGPDSFEYALASDPGATTALGVVQYDINMADGYFESSTFVFREANSQFEVSP